MGWGGVCLKYLIYLSFFGGGGRGLSGQIFYLFIIIIILFYFIYFLFYFYLFIYLFIIFFFFGGGGGYRADARAQPNSQKRSEYGTRPLERCIFPNHPHT